MIITTIFILYFAALIFSKNDVEDIKLINQVPLLIL